MKNKTDLKELKIFLFELIEKHIEDTITSVQVLNHFEGQRVTTSPIAELTQIMEHKKALRAIFERVENGEGKQ